MLYLCIIVVLTLAFMKKIIIIIICSALFFVACDKEPAKGEYIGNFTGYITDSLDSIEFHSVYLFNITKSTTKEIVIPMVPVPVYRSYTTSEDLISAIRKAV